MCATKRKTEADSQLPHQYPKTSRVPTSLQTTNVPCTLLTMHAPHTYHTCLSIVGLRVKLVVVLITCVQTIIEIALVLPNTITATLEGYTCSICVPVPATFVKLTRSRANLIEIDSEIDTVGTLQTQPWMTAKGNERTNVRTGIVYE